MSLNLHKTLTNFTAFCRAATAYCCSDEPANYTPFHSQVEPGVALADYIEKVEKYTGATEECVLLAFVLIGRWSHGTGKLPSALSMHRLFLAALRIATKVHHDEFRSNRTFARIGGVTIAELAKLEIHLLKAVEYDVFLHQHDLDHVTSYLRWASAAPTETAAVQAVAAALRVESPIDQEQPSVLVAIERPSDAPAHGLARTPQAGFLDAMLEHTGSSVASTASQRRISTSSESHYWSPSSMRGDSPAASSVASAQQHPLSAGSGSAAARALKL